jgi:hypothetical protein
VVEGTGLENRHTGEPGIESSNLSLSVRYISARLSEPVCAQSSMSKRYREDFRWVAPKIDVGDGWPSGLRRTPGKCVYVNSVPWVRIPPRP